MTIRVRLLSSTLAGALAVSALSAQQQPQQQRPAPPPPTQTFRAEARLVVHNVTVRDRDGRPIEGLTAKDFVVTENGVAQEIAFVAYQRLADPPIEKPAAAPPIEPAPPLDPIARTEAMRITVPGPGDTRYQDKRLLVLYFDMSAMPEFDRLRAFSDALAYVAKQMTPTDLVAIMALQNGAVRIRQDFTADKPRLTEVLTTMLYGDDLDGDGEPDVDLFGSDFGQNAGEFNIFNTDRRLAALHTAINYLRPLTQQKALIYFASGLNIRGADNHAQYQATVNAAARANVSISTIDTRGLVAFSPAGNASRASPGGMSMFSGGMGISNMSGFLASQDTLYALAADTGGKALLDTNDLTIGIVDAAKRLASYYMVAYYSNNTAPDGKFRNIRITLPGHQSAELSYRPGYYADKVWGSFTEADRVRQLEEAMMLENPLTDITIAMELNYFKLNSVDYFIPVAVKIPGSELTLARRRGAARTEIDFISEIKDADTKVTYTNVRERMQIKLTDDIAAQLASRPIQYQTGFSLLPGRYTIKTLARDLVTGRVGTFVGNFTVPNLEKENTALPISTVVLSSQRTPVGSEIFAIKDEKAQAVDPLIHDGYRMMPSVTRVFSRARDMYVYMQAYQREATTTQPMAVFVTFYRGEEKVLEMPPAMITEGMAGRAKAVPIRATVPLTGLQPGEYEFQISVLEPTSGKAAFWRAPITVVE